MVPARLHIAGTPCTDFSLRGTQAGWQGPTFLAFLCWVCMRLDQQEETCIQENVKEFDTTLLQALVGHLYCLEVCQLNPSSFGFPVERERKWTIMRHKYKTKAWKQPFSIFTKLFVGNVGCGFSFPDKRPPWDAFFSARPDDLFRELEWACNRPESRAGGKNPFATLQDFLGALESDGKAVREAFLLSLTSTELEFLQGYRASKPYMAYSLNQNPQFSETTSSWATLHTVIRNGGVTW